VDTGPERLQLALAAIDRANADDPNTLEVRGTERSKELAHAELVSEWIERLVPTPSEALRLAARAHHIRRWEIPRSDFPAGLAGYNRWRRKQQAHHADTVAPILTAAGYDEATTNRVRALVQKKGLGRDSEVQALEDALCLVFLETQLESTAAKLGDEAKTIDVLRKTMRKMSAQAVALADELPLDAAQRELLRAASAPTAEPPAN
jgi:hypothetical protein